MNKAFFLLRVGADSSDCDLSTPVELLLIAACYVLAVSSSVQAEEELQWEDLL
jgi:hypothetical protein